MTVRRAKPEVLIITPAFFGYEEEIAREFVRQGWRAEVLDERPSNSALMRAVFRVRPSLAAIRTKRYFRRALGRLTNCSFDLVLVIKGEVVPEWFLDQLREAFGEAKFVGYTYDSSSNSRRFSRLAHRFDVAYTFDRMDAEGTALEYLPLFFSPAFEVPPPLQRQHDVVFIGTLHSDRFNLVTELTRGLAGYTYYFVQARWYFAFSKYVSRTARKVPWSNVRYRPLSLCEVAALFRSARCVIDVQRTGQTGLTMRSFEALASGAVLATSNEAITREPFYDPARIVVFSPDDLPRGREMIARALNATGLDPSWVEQNMPSYSLTEWVRTIASARQTNDVT